MIKLKFQFLVVLLFAFLTAMQAQTQNKTLQVGDLAPQLNIVKWFNGEPITEFKTDRIYLVEFSGTWCPPCRKAIPHLTALTKAYQDKVSIISVYLENNDKNNPNDLSYINKVHNLMDAMGNKMDFTVAVDVPQQTTKINWGIRGIPAAYVIQSGTISWIGHPTDLGPVLEKVTKGTFNPQVALKEQAAFNQYFNTLQDFKKKGDYRKAVAGIDSLIKVYPNNTWLPYQKFEFLAGDDDRGAYQWLEDILKMDIKGFDWPHFVGSEFHKIKPENRNYEIELRAINKTIEDSETEYLKAHPFMLKASTYEKMGDYAGAIEAIQQAIKASKAPGGNPEGAAQYENMLLSYQYKNIAAKDAGEAKQWLRTVLDNKNTEIDTRIINTVLETPQTDYDFALELTDRAIKEAKDEKTKVSFLGKKGDIYAAKGNNKKAIKYYEKALNMSKTIDINYLIDRYEKKLAALKTKINTNE